MRVIGLCELQGLDFGLSCHTLAAVIFYFLQGTSNRLFFTPKVVRLHTALAIKFPQFSATARRLISSF